MRKILCIIDGLGSGGAQRQIVGLTLFLKQLNYYVDLAYYHGPNFYSEWLDDNDIKVIKLPLKNNRISKITIVKELIRKNTYDTIIAYMGGPAVICCVLKLIGLKFRLVVSERNVTQKLDFGEKFKFFMYRWADVVTANSYTQTEYIKKKFKSLSDKTFCITNYVDLNYFTPAKIDLIDNTGFTILVVGRISNQKNIPSFLKALRYVKERNIFIKVKWFGDYDKANNGEEMYRNILKLREQLGLTDTIDFFPASKDIVSEYRSCSVFCLPSLFEGFPNVICEAMSCGKPILCSNVCDNPYIVENGVNGFLFDPLSPIEIAEAISKIYRLSNTELIKMGAKSRIIAENKFSSTVFVNKYTGLI